MTKKKKKKPAPRIRLNDHERLAVLALRAGRVVMDPGGVRLAAEFLRNLLVHFRTSKKTRRGNVIVTPEMMCGFESKVNYIASGLESGLQCALTIR